MNLTLRPHQDKLTVCLRQAENGQLFALILDQFDPDSLFMMIFQNGLKIMPAYSIVMSSAVVAHAPGAEELTQALDIEMRCYDAEYKILKELPEDWGDRA